MLPETSAYVSNHLDKLVEFAQLKDDERIIDVGCGMGKFTLPLAALGFDIQGLDLSPVLLEELSRRNQTGTPITTHCADILAPPTELLNQYDTITGFFMLHHLIDIEASFRQMRAMLTPGGKLAFLDVNPYCILYYLQIFLSPSMRWRAERGILNLTPAKLTSSLQNAGFNNIVMKRYGILPPPLRNRFFGPAIDDLFDKLRIFQPVSAFQLIVAERD